MKKLHIFLMALLFCQLPQHIWAQDDIDANYDDDDAEEVGLVNRTVFTDKNTYTLMTLKGIVTDMATGQPLAGVQVKTMGLVKYTAMSEEDGRFNIKVPTFVRSLYAHSPQYLAQEVAIPADTTVTVSISMMPDKFQPIYDDKTTITASSKVEVHRTSSITLDEQMGQYLGGNMHSLQHSAAPGAGISMFIRGFNSLNVNAQPLIVIDGVETDMQLDRTTLHDGQFINLLANISPDDIAQVEVLKNGTALYGARGANGVILINTKRGRSMATRIEANISVGLTTMPTLPTMMNASQYRTYAMDLMGQMDGVGKLSSYRFLDDTPSSYYQAYHNNTNWSDEVYHQALTQQYGVNVQGGDDIGMYNLSVGYADAQSTVRKQGMNRMNVRFNTDITLLRNLDTKFDISISRTNADVFNDGAPESFSQATLTSPTLLALVKSPLVAPYQYNHILGGFSSLLSEADDLYSPLGSNHSLANPIAILENGSGNNKNHAESTFFNVQLAPTFHFSPSLSITEMFSYSLRRLSQRYMRPYTGVPSFLIDGIGTVTSMTGSLFSKENTVQSHTHLDYSWQAKGHDLKARLGFRYSYFGYDDNDLRSQFNTETSDKNPALSSSAFISTALGTEENWKNIQTYATADYNYTNRYFLTLSLMGEANSHFGENANGLSLLGTKWALFPSVQLGWILTNEKWFPKTRGINYLKLTAGFDMSGNDAIPVNVSRTTLSSVIYNYRTTGLRLSNIGNDKIQWETTNKWNVGIEAHLLNNRLSVGADYYIHKTRNLLVQKNFDFPVAGINRYWTNDGAMQNIGIETQLTVRPIVTRDWQMEIGTTLGHYTNKITELPGHSYTTSLYGDNNILTAEGNPAALFYGYKTDGVFIRESDAATAGNNDYLYMKDDAGNLHPFQAGDIHFIDLDGNGIISEEDKTIIGDPNPDIYGNIFTTLHWKNFTLAANFTYSLGNDIYNYQRSIINAGSNFYNQQVQMVNRWRFEGQQTDQPRATYGDPMGNNRMSDRWIEDGSYLRLKTLRISYEIPVPSKWTWLQALQVWGEAVNLFTVSRYLGSDPEISAGQSVLCQGIDTGLTPQSRAFTLGVKINL